MRSWLVTGLALLALPGGAPRGVALTYTRFVADVGAGTVRSVTIGPAGQVTGNLASGKPFTTTIPLALGGNRLASDLAAHHVQVSATTGMSSPLLSVLLSLLPLLLIGGMFVMFVRTARRHAGGLGALGGAGAIAKAKARVIDDERPATRFADVAGYPGLPQARGVDQHVESTHASSRLAHHHRDGVGVAHIALQPGGDQIIRRRSLVVRGGDLGPRLGQDSDGGRTDAGGSAGDQDASALQWCHG